MTTNDKRYHWLQWPVSLNTRKRFQMYNSSNNNKRSERSNGRNIDICTILYDYFDSIYCSHFERKTCVVVIATNSVQNDKNLKTRTKRKEILHKSFICERCEAKITSANLYWKLMIFFFFRLQSEWSVCVFICFSSLKCIASLSSKYTDAHITRWQ